ncbi:MAG: hypothetical protein ABI700_11890 [Chloroflexota bacterium]
MKTRPSPDSVEIAEWLTIAVSTVRKHVRNTYSTFDVVRIRQGEC